MLGSFARLKIVYNEVMKKYFALVAGTLMLSVNAAAADTPDMPRTLPTDPEATPVKPVSPTNVPVPLENGTVVARNDGSSMAAAAAPAPVAVRDDGDQVANRPEGFSVGLGVGYVFPTAWRQPNLVSARFRLGGGLMIEPRFDLTNKTNKVEQGANSATDAQTDIDVSALVHVPLKQRGNVDLNILGGVALSYNVQDPQGDGNNITQTAIALAYGVGVNYWMYRHWSVSLTATNVLIQRNTVETESPTMPAAKQSQLDVGVIWNPQIALMVHLNL
jgi:hypothetical protein